MNASFGVSFNALSSVPCAGAEYAQRSLASSILRSYQYPSPVGSPSPGATGANLFAHSRFELTELNNEVGLWQFPSPDGPLVAVSRLHVLVVVNDSDTQISVGAGSSGGPLFGTGSEVFVNPGGVLLYADIAEPGFPISPSSAIKFTIPLWPAGKYVEIGLIATGKSS